MGLRSGPQSCIRTNFLTDTNFQRRHFVAEEASKRTKQLASLADIFISALEGARAIQSFDPKELMEMVCVYIMVMQMKNKEDYTR